MGCVALNSTLNPDVETRGSERENTENVSFAGAVFLMFVLNPLVYKNSKASFNLISR